MAKIDVKQFVESTYFPRIKDICEGFGQYAEQEAKDRAPMYWTDQTGTARKMLTGGAILPGKAVKVQTSADRDGKNVGVDFTIPASNEFGYFVAHGVSYGFNLSTANNGARDVLYPTVNHFRDDFISAIKKALAGSGVV